MPICDLIHNLLLLEPPVPTAYPGSPGPYRGADPRTTGFLWPANGPHDMANGARESVQKGFGPGLDRGGLRVEPDGSWSYLEFSGWTLWIPSNRLHYVAVSGFNRYGVGWSFGPSSNLHGEHIGYVRELCGIDILPDSMAALDLEHSNILFKQLHDEWFAKFGTVVEPTNPDTNPPSNTNPDPNNPVPPPNPPSPNPNVTPLSTCKFIPFDPSSIVSPILSHLPSDPKWYTDAMEALKSIDDKLLSLESDNSELIQEERKKWIDAIESEIEYWTIVVRRPQVANRLIDIVKRLS